MELLRQNSTNINTKFNMTDQNIPAGLPSDFNDEPEVKDCPTCKGTGKIEDYGEGEICPTCEGGKIVAINCRTIKDALEEMNRHEL